MMYWRIAQLLGLPFAEGFTGFSALGPDVGGVGGGTAVADPAKPTAGGDTPPVGDADKAPVVGSEESRLEAARLRTELERRRGNEGRANERVRALRQEVKTLRASSAPTPDDSPAPQQIAEIVAQTVAQTLSSMGLAKAKGDDPIPGLEIREDGSASYYGQEMDATQVRFVTDAIRNGLNKGTEASNPAIKALTDRLEQMEQRAEARETAETEARENAEIEEMEAEYLAGMRSYGQELCKTHFSHLDEAKQARAAKRFDRDLERVVLAIQDPEGRYKLSAHQITEDVIAKLSKPILLELEEDFGWATQAAQTRVNEEARKDAPLTRGGSVAEPGRPDLDKMTPEQREAEIDRVAAELAQKHGVGSQRAAPSGRPAY